MMERQNVLIILFEKDVNNEEIPENLNMFIKFLQDKLDLVPDEFKDEVEIEFENIDEYYKNMVISYYCPETDEELTRRINNAEDYRRKYKEREKERFRKLLEANPSFFDEFKTMFEKDNH